MARHKWADISANVDRDSDDYRAEYERLMAEADAVIYELRSGVPLKNRLNLGRVDDIDLAAWVRGCTAELES